jgi:uncharacterized membrane protein YqjE
LAASNGNGQANLAKAMTEVSERVTVLIKEEIELAKAEVTSKVSKLSKGLLFGGIGAVLGLLLVPFMLLTIAWVLNRATNTIWAGFVIVTGLILVGTGVCFLLAWRKIKAAGNPAPTMAIDEAKKIRETVSAKSSNGSAPVTTSPSTVSTIVSTAPAAAAPAPAAPVAPAAVAVPEALPAPAPAAVAFAVPEVETAEPETAQPATEVKEPEAEKPAEPEAEKPAEPEAGG